MYDYYRVRFKHLVGGRRSASFAPADEPPRVPMPRALRIVYGASCALAAMGWISAIGASQGHPVFGVALVLLPATVALALGFSEGQGWTRPLMLGLLLLPAAGLAAAGYPLVAGGLVALAAAAGAWLYGSPAVRAYYTDLQRDALVLLERSDLQGALLVPLYTAAAGALAGAWLGWRLVTQHLGYASGLGANDAMAVACTAILCAVLLGLVGRWLGEGLVARWSRTA